MNTQHHGIGIHGSRGIVRRTEQSDGGFGRPFEVLEGTVNFPWPRYTLHSNSVAQSYIDQGSRHSEPERVLTSLTPAENAFIDANAEVAGVKEVSQPTSQEEGVALTNGADLDDAVAGMSANFEKQELDERWSCLTSLLLDEATAAPLSVTASEHNRPDIYEDDKTDDKTSHIEAQETRQCQGCSVSEDFGPGDLLHILKLDCNHYWHFFCLREVLQQALDAGRRVLRACCHEKTLTECIAELSHGLDWSLLDFIAQNSMDAVEVLWDATKHDSNSRREVLSDDSDTTGLGIELHSTHHTEDTLALPQNCPECLAAMDEHDAISIGCGHRWCMKCVRESFQEALSAEKYELPRCWNHQEGQGCEIDLTPNVEVALGHDMVSAVIEKEAETAMNSGTATELAHHASEVEIDGVEEAEEAGNSWNHARSPISSKCAGCLEDVDLRDSTTVPLSCGHDWCVDCLNMNVQQALASRAKWPPKCCDIWSDPGQEIDEVSPHLTEEVQDLLIQKAPELFSENPTYCPERDCGTFIPDDLERPSCQFILCPDPACKKTGPGVCRKCKSSTGEHTFGKDDVECPDTVGVDNHKLIEEGKMQQCPTCRTLIENVEGCDHITCSRCGTDFCYLCSRLLFKPFYRCPCGGGAPAIDANDGIRWDWGDDHPGTVEVAINGRLLRVWSPRHAERYYAALRNESDGGSEIA